ncbi:MAG TPA: trimeric intracellular cation channel family protein [Methylomirabilota bacterium]|nr:trimeric intracellular cation channel family protein [Methylomirabilota bacterium]
MHPGEAVIESVLLQVLDILGTFVFAISGAIAGAKHRLDLFGVLVLSFAAASFGGITRDVLIGAVPPAAIRDWRYAGTSVAAGIITFLWYPKIGTFRNAVLMFDAAGLGLYAVTGASKALSYQLAPVPAALLGMVSAIGGGVVRDVLVSEVPAVFRSEIYASAALAGASIFVGGTALHLPAPPVAVVGALVCFGIRALAIRHDWKLPITRLPDRPAE